MDHNSTKKKKTKKHRYEPILIPDLLQLFPIDVSLIQSKCKIQTMFISIIYTFRMFSQNYCGVNKQQLNYSGN